MHSFWTQLPRPFSCLAPMEGVTDTVFRRVLLKAGRPDVFFSEFISVEGFCSRGYPGMKDALVLTEMEKPVIAQLWGYTPDLFEKTARALLSMGYGGIDINMGCPVRDVMKKGAGAAMIGNLPLAAAVIDAVKKGVEGRVPVSVKTRIGIKEIVTESWIAFLLSQGIEALTVHGRTAKEMSKVPAHWDEIAKVVRLRQTINPQTAIIGNGDIDRVEQIRKYTEKYGVDGVMVGRGIFKNPWIFCRRPQVHYSKEEKLHLLLHHVNLFEAVWKNEKPAFILRKFYKIYCQGFSGALKLRVHLMEAENVETVRAIVHKVLE